MLARKAQFSYIDMFLSVLVFIAAMTIFFKAEVNAAYTDESILDDMILESRLVGDLLMSPGNPRNWDNSTVQELGLVESYELMQSKLDMMRAMSYSTARNRLRTRYDFYVYFESKDGPVDIGSGAVGIGKPGVNSTNINEVEDPDHIIKTVRFAYYNNLPTRMTVLLWA